MFLVFIFLQPTLLKLLLSLVRIWNPLSLMTIKSSSLRHFGQPEWVDVQVSMHLSQPSIDSKQGLTITAGCIVSLQIMHSKQSRISLTMAFCTARAMKKFALSLLSTHFGNSCWVASVTATFTTSLISCRLISDKKKPGCEIQNVSSKAFHFYGFELIAELNTTDRISCHLISCPTVTCGIWLWFLRECILHIQQQTWFCLVCFPVK